MAGGKRLLAWHGCRALNLVGAVAVVAAVLGPAVAQTDSPVRLASTAVQGSSQDPDVFDRISRWFDRSVDRLNDSLKHPPELPDVQIVNLRRRCEPAANGAPDCRRAAEVVCRSRGYATGRSLQTQSQQVCTLPKLFSEAAKSPLCHTETHVLRAICR